MDTGKPRVIKDFEKLDLHIQEQIKLAYPFGFDQHLISFYNKEGSKVSALPFETDEKYYLVRMTAAQARALVDEDEDYNSEGILRESVKEDYEEKYSDVDYMSGYTDDEATEEDEDFS